MPPPPGVHFGFLDLTCANTGVCLGLGSSRPPQHQLYQKILVAISTVGNRAQATARGIVEGQSITCSDSVDCQVAGGPYSPSTSNDGGLHWRSRVHGDREELDQVVCPTALSCRAVGKGRLLATDDGGKTWTSRGPAVGDDYGNGSGLFCLSARVCYAGRSFGRILKTQDGGRTWQSEHNPESGTAVESSSISCGSTRTCVAVGSGCINSYGCSPQGLGSVLMRTSDGGRTWHQTIPPLPAGDRSRVCDMEGCPASVTLSAVTCPTAQRCWAVGALGTILQTANGGRSWQQDLSGTDINLSGVACPSPSRCYAVGEGGAILGLGGGGIPALQAKETR